MSGTGAGDKTVYMLEPELEISVRFPQPCLAKLG